MTLTKADLSEILFDRVGLNKREAKDMVEAFFEEIRNALENGDSIKLSGFGNFELRKKSERPGRNPKTGEEIQLDVFDFCNGVEYELDSFIDYVVSEIENTEF